MDQRNQVKVLVDTNVLIRYILGDDQRQAEAATRMLEQYQALVIPNVVLCEFVWVLRRAYHMDRLEILTALREILARASVEVDRPVMASGMNMLEAGGDFADGCLLEESERQRCQAIVTFDRQFAARAGDKARLLT